ncbi:MAG: hypothetical protein C4570_03840 [Ammonifex sp.]|nr:MAG: hypothetical protein C4570_03840 [Ammonifex sp.]
MPESGEKNVQKGRPRIKISLRAFRALCEAGLPDDAVAEALNVSRPTVVRLRQEHSISPNRRRGERGPGRARTQKTYYEETKRVLGNPKVARTLGDAAREFRKSGGDEVKSFIATGLDPAPVPVFLPGPYTSDPEKTNITTVKYVLKAEERAQQAAVAGVPGPAVFQLARVIKTASESVVRRLAAKAVSEAFFVGLHQTVDAVCSWVEKLKLNLEDLFEKSRERWGEVKEKALAWAPVKEEKKPLFRFRAPSDNRVRTGKVGSGGGRQNVEARRAFAAANGY